MTSNFFQLLKKNHGLIAQSGWKRAKKLLWDQYDGVDNAPIAHKAFFFFSVVLCTRHLANSLITDWGKSVMMVSENVSAQEKHLTVMYILSMCMQSTWVPAGLSCRRYHARAGSEHTLSGSFQVSFLIFSTKYIDNYCLSSLLKKCEFEKMKVFKTLLED